MFSWLVFMLIVFSFQVEYLFIEGTLVFFKSLLVPRDITFWTTFWWDKFNYLLVLQLMPFLLFLDPTGVCTWASLQHTWASRNILTASFSVLLSQILFLDSNSFAIHLSNLPTSQVLYDWGWLESCLLILLSTGVDLCSSYTFLRCVKHESSDHSKATNFLVSVFQRQIKVTRW